MTIVKFDVIDEDNKLQFRFSGTIERFVETNHETTKNATKIEFVKSNDCRLPSSRD